MDSRDRELIARIQLSQLYAADPMVTDFYFQIYNMIKKQEIGAPGTELDEARSAGDHGLTWQQEMLLSRGEGNKTTPFKVTDTMQRRVLEWIKEREERQAKPKSATGKCQISLCARSGRKFNPRGQPPWNILWAKCLCRRRRHLVSYFRLQVCIPLG